MVILARSVYASVAHRYWNEDWDPAKNRQTYGPDASPEGLGSNLRIELALRTDDEGALTEPLEGLKRLVDHQCLFVQESPLYGRPSTLENIAVWLSENLQGDWFALTIWESERLGCQIRRKGNPVLLFKENNLTLSLEGRIAAATGLLADRVSVRKAVAQTFVQLNEINEPDFAKWGEKLFLNLKVALPYLRSVTIDLGRHEALVVHS
jgi:hypothetical protein